MAASPPPTWNTRLRWNGGPPAALADGAPGASMGIFRKRKAGKEAELEGINLLVLAPYRLARWEEMDGRVVVLRPEPTTRGLRGTVDRMLHKMSTSRIRLDEVGSFAWIHLDGERTVGEVASLLREEFGEQVEPAEERLGHLVWLMRREGFLAYPGWDGEGGARGISFPLDGAGGL